MTVRTNKLRLFATLAVLLSFCGMQIISMSATPHQSFETSSAETANPMPCHQANPAADETEDDCCKNGACWQCADCLSPMAAILPKLNVAPVATLRSWAALAPVSQHSWQHDPHTPPPKSLAIFSI